MKNQDCERVTKICKHQADISEGLVNYAHMSPLTKACEI